MSLLPLLFAVPFTVPLAGPLAGPTIPQDVPSAFDLAPLTIGEHEFHRRTLSNGLQVIAVHEAAGADEDSKEETCTVFMVIGAGNRMEGPSTTGLAHLVEHTMFTGTSTTGPDAHEKLLVSWGAESNAFTREDYTLYYDHGFPEQHLETVLAMEADRLRGLTFAEEPFLHERFRLEREEIGAFSQSTARAELLDAGMFLTSPYAAGVRSGDGTTMAVSIPLETVRTFYDQWYHPSNASLVIAGAVDPERALNAAEAAFGHLPAGPAALPLPDEPNGSRGGSLSFASTLPTDKLYHGWIGPARNDGKGSAVDRRALYLVAHVLNERHRDDDGPPLSASMGGRVGRDLFLLGVAGDGAKARLLALRDELEKLPITQKELADAASDLDGEFSAMAIRARPYFSLAATVGTYAVLGDPAIPAEWPALLAEITEADAATAIQRWLPAARFTAVTFLRAEEDSVVEADRAHRLLPEDGKQLAAYAEDASEAGDLEGAILAYEKLLTKGPSPMNSVIYGFYLGSLKREIGDRQGAIEALNTALEIVDYPAVRELRDELLEDLQANPESEQSKGEPTAGLAGEGEGVPSGEERVRVANSGARATSTSLTGELAPGFAEDANSVLADLEEWRGLPFTEDLAIEFIKKQDAYADGINGWYEPETKRLVVIENDNAIMGRGTMLHEMFHGLQDQHFDLSNLHVDADEAQHRAEADRALRGIIEGEAMLAVAELMDYDFGQHTALKMEGELDEARFEKVFHYGAGLKFIEALRGAGGWAQVDRAFRNPPTSTGHILHPDRYLAGWMPEDLSDFGTPECNCDEEPHNARVLGEFGLSIFLARDLDTREDSARVAARLAGDLCYTVHDKKSGQMRWVWYLSFFDELGAADLTKAVQALGLEFWALDGSGRRVGVMLGADPLPESERFDEE
jgi:predicted Zn-dependent peptidase